MHGFFFAQHTIFEKNNQHEIQYFYLAHNPGFL
jgi:hypothetical protein